MKKGGFIYVKIQTLQRTRSLSFQNLQAKRISSFCLVMVTEETMENGHYLISGYMITHDSTKKKQRPRTYAKLNKNPNPNDDGDCFIFLKRLSNVKDSRFSKPYSNWHLSKEDEMFIEELEKRLK